MSFSKKSAKKFFLTEEIVDCYTIQVLKMAFFMSRLNFTVRAIASEVINRNIFSKHRIKTAKIRKLK